MVHRAIPTTSISKVGRLKSSALRVLHVFAACGRNANVVRRLATRPRTSVLSKVSSLKHFAI
jgi:hypothetical protein